LIAAADGDSLFGIDVDSGGWTRPRLVKLDPTTGRVLAERTLAPEVWDIQLADLPAELIARQDVRIEIR
jgi:hypothetical protein